MRNVRVIPIIASLCAALTLSGCGGEAAAPQALAVETTATATAQPSPASLAVARGRILFSDCAACHTVKEGQRHRIGPNLYGVFGAEAGRHADFRYSRAFQRAEFVWTEEALDGFLAAPQAYVRNNRMGYAGVKDAEQRADLIAYLKSLGPAAESGAQRDDAEALSSERRQASGAQPNEK